MENRENMKIKILEFCTFFYIISETVRDRGKMLTYYCSLSACSIQRKKIEWTMKILKSLYPFRPLFEIK